MKESGGTGHGGNHKALNLTPDMLYALKCLQDLDYCRPYMHL